jgi:hypothetical protein
MFKNLKYVGLLVLFIVVIIIQILLGFGIYVYIEGWGNRGTFGDMFGAVNTLFSGLAFAGVIYAIILQGRELELQREELRASRKEYQFSNKLKKMEILNDFYERYESDYYRIIRRDSAKLILNQSELPPNNSSITKPIDDLLNFFQELGILLKHDILDAKFVSNRFASEARCLFFMLKPYIDSVRKSEGPEVWESVDYLVLEINKVLIHRVDKQKALDFIRKESNLDIESKEDSTIEKNGSKT